MIYFTNRLLLAVESPDWIGIGLLDGPKIIGSFIIWNSGDRSQIGYSIGSRYQGNGYCSEALIKLIEVLPPDLSHHKRLIIQNDNWKSNSVAFKSGFVLKSIDEYEHIWEHPTIGG